MSLPPPELDPDRVDDGAATGYALSKSVCFGFWFPEPNASLPDIPCGTCVGVRLLRFDRARNVAARHRWKVLEEYWESGRIPVPSNVDDLRQQHLAMQQQHFDPQSLVGRTRGINVNVYSNTPVTYGEPEERAMRRALDSQVGSRRDPEPISPDPGALPVQSRTSSQDSSVGNEADDLYERRRQFLTFATLQRGMQAQWAGVQHLGGRILQGGVITTLSDGLSRRWQRFRRGGGGDDGDGGDGGQ